MQVADLYSQRYRTILPTLASNIEKHLIDLLSEVPRIDRISARAKSVERFLGKATALKENGRPKYDEPLEQIQDQVGARIIVLFRQDVDNVAKIVSDHLRYIESREVEPEGVFEFSYFGHHFVFLVPYDAIDPSWNKSDLPTVFELQIKTVFQHAWSEASHDIGYKPTLGELSAKEKRALAFASAQAWGADNAFEQIFARLKNGAD